MDRVTGSAFRSFDPAVLERVRFPTPEHARRLRDAVERFEPDPRIKAMILTNSLARGEGDRFSDLDFAVFVAEGDLAEYKAIAKEIRHAASDFEVHMAATTLTFVPREMDLNDLDGYEIRIGNFLAHPLVVFDRDGDWHEARARHLPYYDEATARARRARFRELASYQADCCRIAVERGLAFEAAQRVLQSLSLFFAALFIDRRVYPVDYQKRIEQQVTRWLGLPEVVEEARGVLALDAADPATFRRALAELHELLARWLPVV
jgi:hypothetical protein